MCAKGSEVDAAGLAVVSSRSSADEGSVEGRKAKAGAAKRRKIEGCPSLSY